MHGPARLSRPLSKSLEEYGCFWGVFIVNGDAETKLVCRCAVSPSLFFPPFLFPVLFFCLACLCLLVELDIGCVFLFPSAMGTERPGIWLVAGEYRLLVSLLTLWGARQGSRSWSARPAEL